MLLSYDHAIDKRIFERNFQPCAPKLLQYYTNSILPKRLEKANSCLQTSTIRSKNIKNMFNIVEASLCFILHYLRNINPVPRQQDVLVPQGGHYCPHVNNRQQVTNTLHFPGLSGSEALSYTLSHLTLLPALWSGQGTSHYLHFSDEKSETQGTSEAS